MTTTSETTPEPSLVDRLASALSDLMGAEGGEPDHELGDDHVAAWEAAEAALADYHASYPEQATT